MFEYTGKLNLKEINSQYTSIPVSGRVQLIFIFVDKGIYCYKKKILENSTTGLNAHS